jgi:serine/threonine-protein kinase HipA
MQRFDRKVTAQGVERLAVESMYSLAQVTEAGSDMSHHHVLKLLAMLWTQAGQQAMNSGSGGRLFAPRFVEQNLG